MAKFLVVAVSLYAVLCMLVCTIRWVKRACHGWRDSLESEIARRTRRLEKDTEKLLREVRSHRGGHVTLTPDLPATERPVPQPPQAVYLARHDPSTCELCARPHNARGPESLPQDCDHEWEEFRSMSQHRPLYTKCVRCGRLDTRGSWQPTS